MDSIGVGYRASDFPLAAIERRAVKPRSQEEHDAAIELMARRYASKQDLWTGQPRSLALEAAQTISEN